MEAVTQLVSRAQKKDLTAFEQLVNLYQARVYTLAQRLTGNNTDAEDLAQEAFVRAYRALENFRGDADFGTWLHRITVNVWLNGQRKQRVGTSFSLDEPFQIGEGEFLREMPCFEHDPERMTMALHLSEFMQKALDDLSKEQKAVLLLREVEELSYEEIAVMLNCSLGTVRSRLSRAKEALRKLVVTRAADAGINLNRKDAENEGGHVQSERRVNAREVQRS
ncbi:MAG: ECF RNA polymerase sigma-E factor [Dehalococcoidia bacterium]|nr:ECF RNA polymerase sigma-E factor [Bacillota bacterium]